MIIIFGYLSVFVLNFGMLMMWEDERVVFWYLDQSDFMLFLFFCSSGSIFFDDYTREAWCSMFLSFLEDEWSLFTESLLKLLSLVFDFLITRDGFYKAFFETIFFNMVSKSIVSGFMSLWVDVKGTLSWLSFVFAI